MPHGWREQRSAATRPTGAIRSTPDFENLDEQMMERDNRKALVAAAKDIERERKAH
jgi:hypothetical protein